MVLEEIVGNIAGLSLYPWPAADPEGRLRFEMVSLGVEVPAVTVGTEELCQLLKQRKLAFVPLPTGRSRDREVRVGDVFAVRIDPQAPPGDGPLAGWREVFDISADAREVAKLACFGALTEKWEWKHAEDLLLTELAERDPS